MFNIILLGITSFFTDISSEMVYPILPIYLVTRLGASPAILGFIEGLAESLASLTKVFSGYFSDRFKRRKSFTILGYFNSTLGKFFIYFAGSWPYILAGRIIDRFGKGIRTAPRDAMIAENAGEKTRGAAFGLHRAMDSFGACLGVFLAYLVVTRFKGELKDVFLFSLIPAFIGVLILFLVKEKRQPGVSSVNPPRFAWGSLDKRLKLFLFFTFIFTLGNSSNQFLLLRAKDAGNPLPKVIILYLVYNIVYTLVSYPAARLSDRIGRKTLLVAGYFFYGVVYLGFASIVKAQDYWFLFALYGVYMGFTEGIEKAFIADIAPQNLRATTIGLHATLVGIGLFPASLLAGALWKFFGPSTPFYFGGCLGIISSLGLWFILRGV